MHGNDEAETTRFLPPEPAGPEPELTGRPPETQPAPAQPPQAPPAPPQQTYGYPPPPPGYVHPQSWGYQQQVPDNGQAVTGFVFSLVGVGLLVISFGVSTIVSLGCGIVGVVCSRNGKRKVESGETPKHRGLAQAGYIIGWVGIGLSILAIVIWALVIAFGNIETSTD
ncbi:MAG TPA: DUF4190 domain-containing protein [Thermoleophilaceae bacterium]